jgi:DNA-binding NarL/FixJ family response regulator
VVRVFHCDDSFAYRRLIRGVLLLEDDIELVGEASARETLLAGLAQTHPDVLLLDMVRGVTDADVAGELLAAAPGLSLIILSGHPPEAVDPTLRRLAAAHVTKSTAFAALAQTIRHVGAPDECRIGRRASAG